jgi:hypothetical protein
MIPSVEELTRMSSAELRKVAGMLKVAIKRNGRVFHSVIFYPSLLTDFLDEGQHKHSAVKK